ncbi:MAG: M15 family metallopeptidase [Oscillospiraceae bacterium]|nr:M15 family metallopeptidase [Oscillospiraceae bacterium]
MKSNRAVRVVLGLVVLVLFGAYLYLRASSSPHSDDVGKPADTGLISLAETPAPSETPAPTATPAPTVDPASPEGKAAALGLPKPPDIDVTEWQYMLVNAAHSIDEYAPESLAYLNQTADETDIQYSYNGNRCPVDSRIADALMSMALGCKEAGLPIFLSSGYRSYSDQAANFQRVCANNGISDGKDSQGYYITMPAGCSEHQTGLCCDITDRYWEIKSAKTGDTDTFRWLEANCAQYGFILRFPDGKGELTGVMYEPFHFRYVGVEAATYITENKLCLEEFLALYGVE